ncbi:uncharacterized protein LOC134749623 [Cydia strobilella]|uniref:uncharacterized protein LOC134749623 n=1 Tax=Cydia strobilella TaxID=1100964 RepID=UPI0030058C46
MSKRSHQETNEDRWRRKIKDYEAKLATTKRRRRVIYSSGSDSSDDEAIDVQPEEHLNNDVVQTELYTDENNVVEEPGTELATQVEEMNDPTSSSAGQVPNVDPDLLLALGDSVTDTPQWGDDILQDISQRWEPILKTGLAKEIKEDLLKKYLFPKNVPMSKPPVLNPEVSAMLTETCRSRDARVSSKQNQIGRAIAALGKAMSGILTKSMKGSEVVKILNDAGKLLADSHFLETDTRRSLIMPLLDKSYVTLFKERPRDSFLFGENLGEFIKSSRGIKKTGELIAPTAPSTSSSNLNWAGLPRQQRVNRPPVQRGGGGGQRAPRAAPPPPPPRPRRAPAPPPRAPRRAPPASSRRPAPRSRSPYRRAT